jgi:hypothetical protein
VWGKGDFGPALRTSLIITSVVVLVSVAFSAPAGYAFALMRLPGTHPVFALLILGILMPLESMIVPLFLDMRRLNLDNNYWSVILPQIGFSVAFGAFWMRAYFIQSARSLMDAARIDGANSWTDADPGPCPLPGPQLLDPGRAVLRMELERLPAAPGHALRHPTCRRHRWHWSPSRSPSNRLRLPLGPPPCSPSRR